jgi:hypothetical protein
LVPRLRILLSLTFDLLSEFIELDLDDERDISLSREGKDCICRVSLNSRKDDGLCEIPAVFPEAGVRLNLEEEGSDDEDRLRLLRLSWDDKEVPRLEGNVLMLCLESGALKDPEAAPPV